MSGQSVQRYYDPELGRTLSRDPVTALSSGDLRHFNGYAYAFNNPFGFTDLDGRAPAKPGQCGDQPCPEKPEEREPPRPPEPPKGCGITRSCAYDGSKWRTMSSGETRYWARVNQNFRDANKAVPGILAPPLFGMLTGRALANATKLPTVIDALVGSYRAGYLTLEIAPAAAHLAINFVLVGGSYEAGLYLGSMISAAPVPGSGGITYREWYSDQMCSTSGGC